VATFYHHLDVVKEKPMFTCRAPPALTVRVCDGLSYEMAARRRCWTRLPALLGLRGALYAFGSCVGRCEQAGCRVHQKPVPGAPWKSVSREVKRESIRPAVSYIDFDARERRGYSGAARLVEHDAISRAFEDHGSCCLRAGAARVSDGPQVAHRARQAARDCWP